MTTASRHGFFGQHEPPHTLTIARGGKVRHFTVKPWLARTTAVVVLALAAGGLWAAVRFGGGLGDGDFRADATATEAYELRIASLRSEIDRLTTRGFLDRQKISTKVDVLLDQQAELAERYAMLEPLLDRARSTGLIAATPPIPQPKPATGGGDAGEPLAFAEAPEARTLDRFRLVDRRDEGDAVAGKDAGLSSELIGTIGRTLDEATSTQIEGLRRLTSDAQAKTTAIGDVLRTEGIGRVLLPTTTGGEGGPYVPVPAERRFDAGLVELATALDLLSGVQEASRALPLAAPVAATAMNSTFGVRADPFLGKAAMHTGIDFAAGSGATVVTTAPGTVTFAGENGGYGRMIEIDHGNGLSTRYAHLSVIDVRVGDKVALGGAIGRVGSTGRSTGPHLHYEVRRTGEPIDPARFLKAGRRIAALG